MNRSSLKKFFGISSVLIFAFMTMVQAQKSGNPVFEGWYADPEGVIFDNQYWIYPTYSAPYENQIFMDAFSSPDLVHWTKHSHIVDNTLIKWANKAMWAPAIIKKDNKYYLFFSANDIQNNNSVGGIGVGVSDKPEGPFKDYLGKPLLDKIYNGAQPIDQFVYQDVDKQYYMIYGGWGHCNIVKLKSDFTGFVPFSDGITFKEITPSGYTEGPVMFRRNNKYYFMWSEGGWTTPDYRVAYAVSDTPFGPFNRLGLVLQQNAKIATGAGHHSVINVPGTDEWYIVYHRRPLGETDGNARVTCVDKMAFFANGYIKPVTMTFEGVAPRFLAGNATLYTNCNYSGDSLKLGLGEYSMSDLLSMGFTNSTLSSFKLQNGYKAVLFNGDTFSGDSLTLIGDKDCLSDINFDNKTKSLIIQRQGFTDFSGIYCLQNKESGLFLGVQNDSKVNGTNIVQDSFLGKLSQQFNFKNVGSGYLNIETVDSKKALSVAKSSVIAGTNLQQWDNGNADITNVGGVISAQYFDSPTNEGIDKLIDNSSSTKFLSGHNKVWIKFHVSGKAVVTDYTMTSANDSPERDPMEWVLLGSNDATVWDTLDVRSGQNFATRYLKKSYTCKKTSAYEFYRLDVTNHSGVNLQIAELELLGTPVGEGGFDSQKFVIQPAGDGFYKIFNKFSDKIIDIASPGSGAFIRQWDDNNQQSSLWKILTLEQSSVKEIFEGSEIEIYPNPTTAILHLNGLNTISKNEIFNSVGVKIRSFDSETLDVSDLKSGVYILTVKTKEFIKNLKFVKKEF